MLDNEFIKICNKSKSMTTACSIVNMHFNTFKRKAIKLGCYNPNQPGSNLKKSREFLYDLTDILNGLHPEYQTFKLKNRLIKEGIKQNLCEECGIDSWNNKPINIELDHVDGNSKNHKLNNLRMLCPNCHSQTDTFRAKNIKK